MSDVEEEVVEEVVDLNYMWEETPNTDNIGIITAFMEDSTSMFFELIFITSIGLHWMLNYYFTQ